MSDGAVRRTQIKNCAVCKEYSGVGSKKDSRREKQDCRARQRPKIIYRPQKFSKTFKLLGHTKTSKFALPGTQTPEIHHNILYTWKALEGLVPTRHARLIPCWNDSLGRMCKLNPLERRDAVGNIRDDSIFVRGARYFNLLPVKIKAAVGRPSDLFRKEPDGFLQGTPGQSVCTKYDKWRTSARARQTWPSPRNPGCILNCRGRGQPLKTKIIT